MNKKTYYFQHDFHARHDHKMIKLRRDHGASGYGAYWIIVEILWELNKDIYFGDMDIICYETGLDVSQLQQIIKDYDLFDYDDEKFWSDSQKQRKAKMSDIQLKRQKAGSKGGQTRAQNQTPDKFSNDYYDQPPKK
jgi:hypothetical protein